MTISHKTHKIEFRAAFSLIEMVAVIAILVVLMTAGVSLLNGTGAQSRRAGTDMLSGLIEQARTKAITSRTNVVLAIAEPGDLPSDDERCRVGIFTVENWPATSTLPLALEGVLTSRWQTLNTGIALIAGDVNGVDNPLDQPQVTITYGGVKNLSVKVHAIAFNSRGGLSYPNGSAPIAIRIAEGGYRGTPRKATPNLQGSDKVAAENRLKIGRVTARPYQTDG
ncbi:MAG: prepilin-type N-terminal cleavage/methylation domain-containing protein [Akkermansiaceae bacterium]|nr:prepilin-type N-terminal cleavage/methylation domain-containing protein [Akkermansiaceae bacterium]